MKPEIVLVNPGNREQVYQKLGSNLAAVEPPYLVASIAAYLRNEKVKVRIVDANAENLSPGETAEEVEDLHPLLAAVLVYGSQPSASSQNMTAAEQACEAISDTKSCRVAIAGLHPSALPRKTLQEAKVDYVIEGEEQLSLFGLTEKLKHDDTDLSRVPGLWFLDNNGEIRHNPRSFLLKDLDTFLPKATWDLLPMNKYRAHNWHANFGDVESRSPYGAIYTSLGCPYACEFCCINVPFSLPGEKHTIRTKSPGVVVSEIEFLAKEYGIRHLKIIDEMFVFRKEHYMGIVDQLIEKDLGLNMWAYARVDTVRQETLEKMKKAGINWLGLGIESADASVRDHARKHISPDQIVKIVKMIQDSGMHVGANFIFGLPNDTKESMKKTLDLAMELNTEWANFYCAMAYPGSKLYTQALRDGQKLPDVWHGYSQHAYETQPLSTKNLSAAQVLKFRDDAFDKYFKSLKYLDMIEQKFGTGARAHIEEMTKTRLPRRLLTAS